MESPLQLAVAPELHKHDLIEEKAYQVERFRNGGGLISGVGHLDKVL